MITVSYKTAGIALMILSLPTFTTIDIKLTCIFILFILVVCSLSVGAKIGDSLAKYVFKE